MQINTVVEQAIESYILAAEKATEIGLGINAGHDLNLENLAYFSKNIKNLDEVSIGHALISDALYLGLENTIQMYKRLSRETFAKTYGSQYRFNNTVFLECLIIGVQL